MAVVLIVNADDWEALYVDGVCVAQGHQIHPDTLFSNIEGKYIDSASYRYVTSEEDGYLANVAGEFPRLIDEMDTWPALWQEYVETEQREGRW